jgi:hypothetical protein
VYRNRLDAWRQSAYDPTDPETIASVDRALAYNREERAKALIGMDGSPLFDDKALEFLDADAQLIWHLPTLIAARVAVLRKRRDDARMVADVERQMHQLAAENELRRLSGEPS